jgi:hypothetical protein
MSAGLHQRVESLKSMDKNVDHTFKAAPDKRNSAHDTLLHRNQSEPRAGDDGSVWGDGAPVDRAISSHSGRDSGSI